MSGVAAKARGVSHINTCLVKRNIRLRQRAALRSLRIPVQAMEGPGLNRDTMFSPHTENIAFSSMTMLPVQFLPGPETLRPLEVDTDTDTETTISSRTSSCLTDLSNFLGISRSGSDDDMAMQHVHDSDTLSRESSCDADSYGWETEYDRKVDCRNADPVWSCHTLGYPRGMADKQSLLHRVFSPSEK
ncbi:hypothetical protein HD806DRAFT_365266 [Xylariaceae sp. AK1471]|nr:hypothetical protein HD806DRAFT_365266 [Xylariaceae sp. AK1471]